MKMTINVLALCFTFAIHAQVGVGTVAPQGALDVTSTTNGMLIPRVALTTTTVAAPVVNPQGGGLIAGTLIWNTATAGIAPNNVNPGYYYWDGSAWTRLYAGNTNAWNLTGNTGTSAATNYIGTADATDLRIRTGATNRWNISNANNGQLQPYSLGTAALPIYSFQADPNTGLFSSGADMVDFSTAGTGRFRIPNANQVHGLALGTAALPFYTFSADPDTGMFSNTTNTLGFSTAATERMRLLSTGQISVNNTGAPNATSIFSAYASGAYIRAIYGASTLANGRGIVGEANNTGSAGVQGLNNNAQAFGLWGYNGNLLNGTGVMGTGHGEISTYLTDGSGGAFTGYDTAIYGFYTSPAVGQAMILQDDFLAQWNAGYWDGFSYYKILGDGAVSTTVDDLEGNKVVMHCTETPENLFEDYGTAKLVNGRVKIEIDPIFSKNILVDEKHPLKVFVQLEGECNGVYITNKSAVSFEVVELKGGQSNTAFSYSIVATRGQQTYTSSKGETRTAKYDRRFEPAPKHKEHASLKTERSVAD